MIIISDVDKTLLPPGGAESPCVRALFDDAVAHSVHIGLASARSLRSLEESVPYAAAKSTFLVCSDGALAFRRGPDGDLHDVFRALIRPSSRWVRALASVRGQGSLFVFCDAAQGYEVFIDGPALADPEILTAVLQGRPWQPLRLAALPSAVLSVALLAPKNEARVASDLLERKDAATVRWYQEVRMAERQLWWTEVSHTAADKAKAFRAVAATLENATPPVILLADGRNDLQLARQVDQIYCPPWAEPELAELNVCSVSAGSCDEFVTAIRLTHLTALWDSG